MDSTGVREVSLADSLNGEWVKLPWAAVRESGPSAQTLGGLLKTTTTETFISNAKIAQAARVNPATSKRHINRLLQDEWIMYMGRQATRSGVTRRTPTLRLTDKARESRREYGVLPWWTPQRWPWSTKVLLSLVMSQFMKLSGADDDTTAWDAVDRLGGKERFRFSLRAIQSRTGLSRGSAVKAKYHLLSTKCIKLIGGESDITGNDTDILYPNEDFVATITPIEGSSRVYIGMGEREYAKS